MGQRWSAWVERLRPLAARLRALGRRKWVRATAQLVLLTASLLYLGVSLQGVARVVAGLKLQYSLILLALALTVAAVFLGTLAWWFILRSLGQAVRWSQGARVHLVSNLAKYLPGYAWQLASKAYLTQQLGVAAGVVGMCMVIELAELVLVGLSVVVAGLPVQLLEAVWDGAREPVGGVVRVVVFLGIIFAEFTLPYTLAALFGKKIEARPRLRWLLPAIIVVNCSWTVFGFSFWLLGASLTPLQVSSVPLFMFALAVALLTGLIVVFVPGGIGIRESILVFVLGPYISPPIAVLVAGLSRLIVVISETLGAGLLLGLSSIMTNDWRHKVELLLMGYGADGDE